MTQEIKKLNYHKSVLTKEVVENLQIKPNGLYIDATFGGGGHTKAILKTNSTCKVVAIDWDQIAIETNAQIIQKEYKDRFKIIWGNFALLYRLLKKEKISQVDGILADFGTSQFQIHSKSGFSFQKKTPLDMRMSSAHSKITAADILNTFSENDLSSIFFELGEEQNAKKFARAIVAKRKKTLFKTTEQLTELIESLVPPFILSKKRIHPATKVFQALRIFVNKELDNIQSFLKASISFLRPGGRICCISFHSLEDRIVKRFFKENPTKLNIITKKPITPTEQEIKNNPSSRSAKLRTAEKY